MDNQAESSQNINIEGGLDIKDHDLEASLPKVNLKDNISQPSTSTNTPKPSTSSQADINSLKRKQPSNDEVPKKIFREASIELEDHECSPGISHYYKITLAAIKDDKVQNYFTEREVTIEDKFIIETEKHLLTLQFQSPGIGKNILRNLYEQGYKARNLTIIKLCEDLQSIFPDIDYEYRKLYSRYCLENGGPGPSHEVQFSTIKEKTMLQSEALEIDKNLNNVVPEVAADDGKKLNIDDIYEYLTGIFPNADPHYLRSAAENFKDENNVKAFVDDKLESNDYPTREQNSAKTKVTEEQARYTTNFDVEQFLTVFPDPFTHFENGTRQCQYSLIVAEFLKNEFNRVRVNTVHRIYQSSKFNMSIAAKNLRLNTNFISKARVPRELPTENIQQLQEMAFVRHHEAIRKHMEVVKQKEDEELNSLKAAGGLWTCECCYDDECVPSKCSTCDNAHVFCNSCVVKGTDTKLGDGETRVPCFLNCGSELSVSTLQKVLPLTKFNILLQKRQAAEVMVAGLEGLVSCPFCHFASIPPEGDKVFKCLNPECMKESCILCKEPNHVPLKCEEQQKKDKARKYIEEKMTQALTRTCYKCNRVFFKEEGCNKMTCPCGAIMCYICNNPVKDYRHFAGQGSNEVDKCPLWTDNHRLNAEAVKKVEEDARMILLRQDPNLDIGPTRLAPDVPPPMPEPHHGMPDTHNIANMLAARVLNAGYIDLQ